MPYLDTPLSGIERVPSAPTACLILLHGLAEHCGRYESIMDYLAATGIACFAYDQRGHGRSPGARGDIDRFSRFAEDFHSVRAGIGRRYPRLPTFLWGHSLGSIVAILAALDPSNALSGVITSGCPVAVRTWPRPYLNVIRGLVALAPTTRVSTRLPVDALTHVEKVKQDYRADPLVQERVTLRLLSETLLACNRCLLEAPWIQVPWLAVHGGEDSIAPPQGSRMLVDRLGSADKTLETYPGLFHEVHNEAEPAASAFRLLISTWIRDRNPKVATER